MQAEGDLGVEIDSGSRSKFYGDVQRKHREWLTNRISEVSNEEGSGVQPAIEFEDADDVEGNAGGGGVMAERVRLLEMGVRLWDATYVPPIEPVRRQELINEFSGAHHNDVSTTRKNAFNSFCTCFRAASAALIRF